MPESRRRGTRFGVPNALSRSLVLALVLLLGFVAWPALGDPTESAFRATSNALLTCWQFGEGGRAVLSPAPQERASLESADSWDTRLSLYVTGASRPQSVRVNPRRLLYLPLVLLLAIVAAAPLSVRRKLRCLAIGVPVLWAFAIATVVLLATWLFARVPGLVYTLGPVSTALLELSYRALVVPLANKFLVALLLATGLVVWQLDGQRSAGATTAPTTAQATAPSVEPRPQPRRARPPRPRRNRSRS